MSMRNAWRRSSYWSSSSRCKFCNISREKRCSESNSRMKKAKLEGFYMRRRLHVGKTKWLRTKTNKWTSWVISCRRVGIRLKRHKIFIGKINTLWPGSVGLSRPYSRRRSRCRIFRTKWRIWKNSLLRRKRSRPWARSLQERPREKRRPRLNRNNARRTENKTQPGTPKTKWSRT